MTARNTLSNRWRALPVPAIASLAGAHIAAILWWYAVTPDAAARQHLIESQFWVLELQFVLFAALTWLCLPSWLRTLQLQSTTIGAGVAASLLVVVVVSAAVPKTNRIFYDEHIYQGIAQNLSDLKLAQMCNDGNLEYGRLQCARGEYNKQPYGYPYALSLIYRIAGTHENAARWLNLGAAIVFVWVVLLLTCALWEDQRAAAFAALAAAMMPQHLLWSGTASVEPSAALMAALAVLAGVHFIRVRTTSALLWMIVASVFAIQWRPESLLVAVVIGALVVGFARETLAQRRFWWSMLLAALLCTPYMQHLLVVRNEPWGTDGERIALAHLWPNLSVNGLYFLNNVRFPIVFTLLALCGTAARRSRATAVTLVYFLVFWGVFLFFYAGSYDYGADVRYALMAHAPVAMLAGVGASAVVGYAVRMQLGARRAAAGLLAVLALQFLAFMPLIRAVGEEGWAARADVAFVDRVAGDLPPRAMVLTHNPSLFHLRGINAAQMSLAVLDPEYVWVVLPMRYSAGVFLHWNYWCNTADATQVMFCKTALGGGAGNPFREYRERDYRYAFYRLDAGEPRMLLKRP